jgi:hypothetical protein
MPCRLVVNDVTPQHRIDVVCYGTHLDQSAIAQLRPLHQRIYLTVAIAQAVIQTRHPIARNASFVIAEPIGFKISLGKVDGLL